MEALGDDEREEKGATHFGSASHLSILLSEVSDGKVYLLEERPTLPNVLTYLA